MSRWLVRRILQAIVTYAIAMLAAFVLMRLAPGDPLARLTDDKPIPPAETERLRKLYGLDQPIGTQFVTFLNGVAHGDLGTSIQYARPVTQLVRERLPASLLLGGTILLLNFTVGVWLGVRQAVRAGRLTDMALGVISTIGIALPTFWLGLVLVWAFGLHWPNLPVTGIRDPLVEGGVWTVARDVLLHLILPATTLTIVTIGATMRYQRSAMLDALVQPFVLTARAKGLTPRQVTWGHAWRAAVVPMVTLLGLWLPILVTGSIFAEQIFSWPGIGSLAAQAASARDYPLVMGATLLAALLIVLGTLVADLLSAVLDPRLRPA